MKYCRLKLGEKGVGMVGQALIMFGRGPGGGDTPEINQRRAFV